MPSHLLRAAALAAALLPASWAGAAPLSLEQAIDLALQRSQLTRSARAGAESATEMARAAGQQPDPMLTAGLENLPVTGGERFRTAAEDMTMKRIGLAQEWVGADKRAARTALAQSMAGRESAMEGVAVAQTRLQTALAYVDAWYAREALQLALLNEAHAREALEAGKGRLAGGANNSADVLALSSALGIAEDESHDLRQQQGASAAGLQRWLGIAVHELARPGFGSLLAEADYVATHPEVVARQRDIDVARNDAAATRLNRRPNWTWEVSYGQRQGRADLVSLGVSIPLPVAPASRQDREAAAKEALVGKADAEWREAERAAAAEYATLASDTARLRERIDRYELAVITPAQQRTAATLAAYRANQAGLVMLFEARHAELEARRKLLALQRDLARAQAQLAYRPIHRPIPGPIQRPIPQGGAQ